MPPLCCQICWSRLVAGANFERYAAYTNRQPHTGEGWELSVGVELVRQDGELTPSGELYADK